MNPDPQLLAADEQARADALDVTRSFVVQAPAGSGKTELLIQRYLALLSTVDVPEEVVAITFTEKAAEEMRLRVLDAIGRAAKGAGSSLAHERTTDELALRVLKHSDLHGWSLSASPARLRVQTLDAFCAGIARSMPLTSGLSGQPGIVQDSAADALYRDAAIATLDWLVEDSPTARAVESILQHLDNNTGIYTKNLSSMLARRDQWLGMLGRGAVEHPDRLRAVLEDNIGSVVREHLRSLRTMLSESSGQELVQLAAYAASRLEEKGETASPILALKDRAELPGTDVSELAAWRGVVELLLTKAGSWRRSVNERQGFPRSDSGEKAAWLSLLTRLASREEVAAALHSVRAYPEPSYSDRQWQVLLSLFHVLPVAVVELKRLFLEQGVCDHTEVALAAAAALGSAEDPGQAALMLDYRIRHLLVDEMQDTSIGQYRLLETLTSGWQPGDGRTLFSVGDPMQSIYRFRDAEVGQFLRMQECGMPSVALTALTLRRNFRSCDALVAWFNDVFVKLFPAQSDPATGAVAYRQSIAARSDLGEGSCTVHPVIGSGVEAEAKRTADTVEDLLAQNDGEEVAVLVRSRTQLSELLSTFRDRGMGYEAVEIDRLVDLPEIVDPVALTRAYAHPGDRAAWLAVLRGPAIGLSWADLHALVLDSDGLPVRDLLRQPSRLKALSEGGRSVLERALPVIDSAFAPDGILTLRLRTEAAWHRLGGPGLLQTPAQLANVYRYFDLLEGLEVAGTLADPAVLLRHLEDERVSTSGGAERLKVMTMHKAKGLQFDHVVLPSLGRFSKVSSPSVLSWLSTVGADGSPEMIMSPIGPRYDLARDPLHRFIENSQRGKEQLELDRLLYVACTRARKSLHLIGHAVVNDKGELKAPHPASLLARLWADVRDTFDAAAVAHSDEAPSGPPPARWMLPTLRRAEPQWRIPEPPEIPQRETALRAHGRDDEVVSYRWVGSDARHAGTIVHRWLQRLTEVSGTDDIAMPGVGDRVVHEWARGLGVPEERLDTVCNRARQAVSKAVEDATGQWLLSGEGHTELALTGVHREQVSSIVIDRVKIDGPTHWIVDYKTGAHQGGNLETFIDAEVERYRPQLERYADIYRARFGVGTIKTALYFPLLQVFREVDASC
ncbi:MAG: UvrD-helicase domain-containing protein [Pseudomonadota bacterium]